VTKSVKFRLVNVRFERKGWPMHPENVIHKCAISRPKFDKLDVMLHSGVEIL
jgi:hypothetical protein